MFAKMILFFGPRVTGLHKHFHIQAPNVFVSIVKTLAVYSKAVKFSNSLTFEGKKVVNFKTMLN